MDEYRLQRVATQRLGAGGRALVFHQRRERGHQAGRDGEVRRERVREPNFTELADDRVRDTAHAARGRVRAVEDVHVVGFEPAQERIHEPRLADSGFAFEQDGVAVARDGEFEALTKQRQVVLAPVEFCLAMNAQSRQARLVLLQRRRSFSPPGGAFGLSQDVVQELCG